MARQRRRNRNSGMQQQRLNALIKGSIQYAKQVDINMQDFVDFKLFGDAFPVMMKVTITMMNAPSYCSLVQWNAATNNKFIRIENMIIPKTREKTFTFRWPRQLSMNLNVSNTQALVTIYHPAGGDVYGSEKPLLFYLAKLTVTRCSDMMDTTVDPPHINTKHGTSTIYGIEEL